MYKTRNSSGLGPEPSYLNIAEQDRVLSGVCKKNGNVLILATPSQLGVVKIRSLESKAERENKSITMLVSTLCDCFISFVSACYSDNLVFTILLGTESQVALGRYFQQIITLSVAAKLQTTLNQATNAVAFPHWYRTTVGVKFVMFPQQLSPLSSFSENICLEIFSSI